MRHTSFRIEDDIYEKVEGFLTGTKTVSQFAFEALEEKIRRMEVRDKNARLQLHKKDTVLLEPIITDVLKGYGLIE